MRHALPALAAAMIALCMGQGCSDNGGAKKDAPKQSFDPDTQYPGWAYDAPMYYEPPTPRGDVGDEIGPQRPGDPSHYFVRSHMLYIPRPEQKPDKRSPMPELGPRDSKADLAPRIAVYRTETGGQDWERAGCFGLGQTCFVYPVDCDGVYGFRFVGPGLPPSKCTPPRPQVVYHVDTLKPQVVVHVEPNQAVYYVDQTVTIHWSATDTALAENPVSVSTCWESPDLTKARWTKLLDDQLADGSTTFVIPPDAVDREIVMRAAARDRAGNLGVGFSVPMPVTDEPPPPDPEPTEELDAPETTTQPGLKPGLIQVGDSGRRSGTAVALKPIALDEDAESTNPATGLPGGIVPMGIMSLFGDAELTSFVSQAPSSGTARPLSPSSKDTSSAKTEPVIVLPPISAEPAKQMSKPTSTAPAWQRLSPEQRRARRGVWALPPKLPLGVLQTDRDTPEARPLER